VCFSLTFKHVGTLNVFCTLNVFLLSDLNRKHFEND